MAYVITYCGNQCRKSGEDSKDTCGYPYIFCRITNKMCTAQRWCPEQEKYIVSERANKTCKNYKD